MDAVALFSASRYSVNKRVACGTFLYGNLCNDFPCASVNLAFYKHTVVELSVRLIPCQSKYRLCLCELTINVTWRAHAWCRWHILVVVLRIAHSGIHAGIIFSCWSKGTIVVDS